MEWPSLIHIHANVYAVQSLTLSSASFLRLSANEAKANMFKSRIPMKAKMIRFALARVSKTDICFFLAASS